MVETIQNEILHSGDPVTFEDIAGLDDAKETIQEIVCWPMKRPDLFTGLRRTPNGLLLFGTPTQLIVTFILLFLVFVCGIPWVLLVIFILIL